MNYKLIAIDMDDTFLKSDLTISNNNKKAIKKTSDLDVKVVFCSGRSEESMLYYINELKNYGCNEYFISCNGAEAKDIKNNRKIFSYFIEEEIVNDLILYARNKEINVQIYTNNKLYVETYNNKTKYYENLSRIKANVVSDLMKYSSNGSAKVLFNDESKRLENIKNELEEKYKNKLNIFFSKSNFLECLNIKINKGIALLELARYLGIKQEETIAIGDSFNDLSMIEMAGFGVAIANAHEKIKEKAKYITKNTNNEDGVAEIIEKFILNNS